MGKQREKQTTFKGRKNSLDLKLLLPKVESGQIPGLYLPKSDWKWWGGQIFEPSWCVPTIGKNSLLGNKHFLAIKGDTMQSRVKAYFFPEAPEDLVVRQPRHPYWFRHQVIDFVKGLLADNNNGTPLPTKQGRILSSFLKCHNIISLSITIFGQKLDFGPSANYKPLNTTLNEMNRISMFGCNQISLWIFIWIFMVCLEIRIPSGRSQVFSQWNLVHLFGP